jgi:hypothetical protein
VAILPPASTFALATEVNDELPATAPEPTSALLAVR